MPQAWQRAPQQGHGTGYVWSRHGRAAETGITSIGGIACRARAGARSRNVGLDPVTPIDYNRAAAAKPSNGVGAGVQCSNRIRSCINSRRILHSGTTPRTPVPSCYHHHNSSSSLSFNGSLQRVRRTTFRRRADPGVTRNIGCFGRVALIGCAVERVRRQEPFHALDVSGWCAVALVHVTATNPFCARRHPDLVAHAIVTDHGTCSVRAVFVVIARKLRIVAARIADAVMD